MPNERAPDDDAIPEEDAQRRGAPDASELAAHTRLGLALLGLVAASALLLVAASWIGDGPRAAGGPHAEIAQMQHGGPSAARGGALLAAGAGFGALQIVFFGVCFALGMRRRGGLGPLRTPLVIGIALYLGVWLAVVFSYASYAADPAAAGRFAGLPIPTALLLFGLWPFPVYFVALYLRHFDGRVLDDASLAAFRRRVAALAAGDAARGRGDAG